MVKDIVEIKRALISVSDKSGLADLLKKLDPQRRGIEIISSGGTAGAIRKLGYTAIDVEIYTGYPESPGGYVKTLQPKIHNGILLDTEDKVHTEFMEKHGVLPIDLVVNNLYPFKETVKKEGITIEKAREDIDIGGSALIRASSKSYKRVATLIDWQDLELLELSGNSIITQFDSRYKLAQKGFEHTASYDAAIADYLLTQGIQNKVRPFYFGDKK